MQYQITLSAGVKKRQEFTGSTLILMDIGAALSVDLSIEIAGFSVEELRGVKRGLKVNASGFTGASFLSSVDTTLQVIASAADLSINYQDGNTVNANILGTVPVALSGPQAVINDRGAPGNPVNVVGITYSDAPAVTLKDNTATAVTSAGAELVAANAARRSIRITNQGPDAVALGFTGITWTKRCIVLAMGDTWIEDRAANLAWSAICEAAKTANVTVQEVLA